MLIELILQELNLQRKEVLYVGDSDIDIDYQLANNADVDFLYVRHGYGDITRLPEDVVVIQSLSDIGQHIVAREIRTVD